MVVAASAHPATELREIIATPGDKTRNFFGGPVRDKLTTRGPTPCSTGDGDGWKLSVTPQRLLPGDS